MSFNLETYLELRKRLSDWLRSTGGDVTNLPLDLLNRAQNWLTEYRRWTDMMVSAELTAVSGETNSFYLPSDMAAFTMIFYDSDSDGKPEKYYYRHARHDDGYEITDTFDKSTGHSWVVKFYTTPSYTPKAYYQRKLVDFTNDEVNTQYSFFPGELLLRTAQLIHIEETGLTGTEVQVIINSQKGRLKDYAQAHHNVNNDLRMEINDDSGSKIKAESMDLTGNFSSYNNVRGYENSVDLC